MAAARQKFATTLPSLIRNIRKKCPKPMNQTLPSLRSTSLTKFPTINCDSKETGFTVNGVEYEGSLLIVDKLLMSWSPKRFSDITPESLSVFRLLRPVPEILLLGCGRYIEPVNPELRRFIHSTGMKFEAVDSRNAASTFNILNEEGRLVAAALLPFGVSSQP